MRMQLVATIAVAVMACGDGRRAAPIDAAPDAPPDTPLPESSFFGESCELATYPGAVANCRCEVDPFDGLCRNPKGMCVDEPPTDGAGVCRPYCDQLHPQVNPEYVCIGPRDGGIVTWAIDNSCYCRPPA